MTTEKEDAKKTEAEVSQEKKTENVKDTEENSSKEHVKVNEGKEESKKVQDELKLDEKENKNGSEKGKCTSAPSDANPKDKAAMVAEGNDESKKKQDEPKVEEKESKNGSEKGGCTSDANVKENAKESENGDVNMEGGDSSLVSEEKGLSSDLAGYEHIEKKALAELKTKVENAIQKNKLFRGEKKVKEKSSVQQEEWKKVEGETEQQDKGNEETNKNGEKAAAAAAEKEGSKTEEGKEETKPEEAKQLEKEVEIDRDISLWDVPLLPSKGDLGTDVVLLKFLRAREFEVNDAFEMLQNTLEWRKENKLDSIMEEDFGNDYDSLAYMSGVDREGHPVCYNIYGVFADNEVYSRAFETEANRDKFLRWRLQLMEKQIQKLDLKPGGLSSLIQINDLKNTPGPSRKDLHMATKQAVAILQDNYPEFVARNIFVNVPFWYYAFNVLLSPFLTQRTKSKFVLARPARVTDTLLKYIAAEQIPVQYGGLKKENDPDFSTEDVASEVTINAGATETIEIPAPEVGDTLIWDVTVTGWDVNYKEEFVPTDEGSYTVIVKKGKKISWQEDSIRNTFRNNEPGKVVITIENGIFRKKRALYRYKIKK